MPEPLTLFGSSSTKTAEKKNIVITEQEQIQDLYIYLSMIFCRFRDDYVPFG